MLKRTWPPGLRGMIWLVVVPLLAACNLNEGEAETVITGAPVVQLAAPLPNATFLEGVPVNIQALITNAGPDIGRVEVVVDGTVVASLATPNTSGAPTFSLPTQSWPATGTGPHTITVTAFRGDGSSSTPATVNINVVGDTSATEEVTSDENTQDEGNNSAQADPTDTPRPTDPPEPTDEPEPEATDTPSSPTVTITTGVNMRRGPSTVFNPPSGSMPANATAEIIAVNPSGDWYRVRSTYGEGWVSAAFVTVSGDISNLPVDAGPPTPVPFTDTPVPTATPATSANLVIVGTPVIDPHPLECGETASIEVTVRNDGSGPAASGGMIFVEDVRTSDGSRQQSTEGVFPLLQPGQSHTSEMFLTVSTHFNEGHRIVITIDSNNQVPETNEDDNRFSSEYALAEGDC